jgi:hypothetical protein
MAWDFLYRSDKLTESDLYDIEQHACKNDTLEVQLLCRLVTECRKLQHELNDPNYQYSGRIHRQAIICRDAEIDRLRTRLKEVEKELKDLLSEEPMGVE